MSIGKNRIQQTPSGTWFFKFKFEGVKYCHTNFCTKEQAEQALQLQYKVLNLTTTGQKRNKLKSPVTKTRMSHVSKNISLMYNGKYNVRLQTKNICVTIDTLEEAIAFRDQHAQPRKRRIKTARTIKQTTLKTPAINRVVRFSSFVDKTERAKQAFNRKQSLNKAIAELNKSMRTIVKATTPTIAELAQIAKTQINPRQYYIEQLKAGAYRA